MNAKAKGSSNSEKWGLGLLVLFLDDDKSFNNKKKKNPTTLISRAQSTISICALILLFTILLFTLSTSDPTSLSPTTHFPRRWLAQSPNPHSNNINKSNPRSSSWLLHKKKKNKWKNIITHRSHNNHNNISFALQGMGTLFRRGNRAMTELLVAHLTENTTQDHFRLFLRTLHRSGITARADVVFLFPSTPISSFHLFSAIIHQESDSFIKLLTNSSPDFSSITHFDSALFKNNRSGEPLWGYRNHSINNSSNGEKVKDELGELSWGSVVGFEASELDPEDSLSGFLDWVPMQLRRWACYQMLLGRIRRNFKQVLLVGVNDILIFRDVFSRIRTRSSDSIHLWKDKDNKDNDSKQSVTASIVMGGIRSIRRLSNALLMEIVRVTTQRKNKTRNSDSAMLTHLLWNTSLLKKVKIAFASIPNSNSILFGNNSKRDSSESDFIIWRGDFDENVTAILVRDICSSSSSSSVDSSVYRDC